MTVFLRLLESEDKERDLAALVLENGKQIFDVDPISFARVPGSPFSYWVSGKILNLFQLHRGMRDQGYVAWVGLQTNEDFRWVRTWWENTHTPSSPSFPVPFAKGGSHSPYYADVYLTVRWGRDGTWLKEWKLDQLRKGRITANNSQCWNEGKYFIPGLTWPRRTKGLSFRVLPSGCIFADKGPSLFAPGDDAQSLLALAAIVNSRPYRYLVTLQLARTELAQSYEVGVIQRTPLPKLRGEDQVALATLARQSWSLKRTLDSDRASDRPSNVWRPKRSGSVSAA